ncbi:hypothetical protein EON81_10670 [bacterium]|nr:MAG: hypothetical protein EON81_10670 [bacterium]
MITTAVIALAATATMGQVQGRTAWGPYSPWTDGIASGLSSPASVVITEGQPFTVNVTGTDWDQYIEITTKPNPQVKELGNWQTIRGAVSSAPMSTGSGPTYVNGLNGNVTMRYNRVARTFALPASNYPIVGIDEYEVWDGQSNTPGATNPNYVLWDSNESSEGVSVTVNKKP